jgi:hypothetical protein
MGDTLEAPGRSLDIGISREGRSGLGVHRGKSCWRKTRAICQQERRFIKAAPLDAAMRQAMALSLRRS